MRTASIVLLAVVGLLSVGCASSSGDSMSVGTFLRTYPTGTSDVITVKGPVIESLNDRTFAMGEGNEVILVVAPTDQTAVGTRADAGDTVVVTGTAQIMRRGDPALPFVDERVKDALLNHPGIIASNVQVVAVN